MYGYISDTLTCGCHGIYLALYQSGVAASKAVNPCFAQMVVKHAFCVFGRCTDKLQILAFTKTSEMVH
jgi:hypothetical protein